MFSSLALAQGAAQGATPSFFEQIMPFVFIILIFYFFLIRPQQRRAKEHQNFLGNLKRGDTVLTSGGIFGTIEGLTDQFVTLEIADDVRIRVLKSKIEYLPKQEEKK